jgi:hypothetical protein
MKHLLQWSWLMSAPRGSSFGKWLLHPYHVSLHIPLSEFIVRVPSPIGQAHLAGPHPRGPASSPSPLAHWPVILHWDPLRLFPGQAVFPSSHFHKPSPIQWPNTLKEGDNAKATHRISLQWMTGLVFIPESEPRKGGIPALPLTKCVWKSWPSIHQASVSLHLNHK